MGWIRMLGDYYVGGTINMEPDYTVTGTPLIKILTEGKLYPVVCRNMQGTPIVIDNQGFECNLQSANYEEVTDERNTD